jgi:hypothetical protein
MTRSAGILPAHHAGETPALLIMLKALKLQALRIPIAFTTRAKISPGVAKNKIQNIRIFDLLSFRAGSGYCT